jgi:hypothetical protein
LTAFDDHFQEGQALSKEEQNIENKKASIFPKNMFSLKIYLRAMANLVASYLQV